MTHSTFYIEKRANNNSPYYSTGKIYSPVDAINMAKKPNHRIYGGKKMEAFAQKEIDCGRG